jgi:two-component system, chemotaxis family, protein-glutamate methylesterase/glutaminase
VTGVHAVDEETLTRDLVVIGASAGGVEALKAVASRLPRDLPAAVCIVLHIAPTSTSALAVILARAGELPCRPATDGEVLRPGHILVAVPDHHLIVEDGTARVTVGPRENNHRPSIDTLFRSAAHAHGRGVVGVVLSGTRDDGSAGLALIKSHGGAAVVQDPEDALYPGMPSNAIAHVAVDAVAPAALVADAIVALVHGAPLPDDVRASDPTIGPRAQDEHLTLVCPECGGVLSERDEHGVPQWRCHVGHLYSADSLGEAQGGAVEAALWTALRSLEDRAALMRRLAEHAEQRGRPRSSAMFGRQAERAQRQADLVRTVVRDAAAAAQRAVGDPDADEPMPAGEVA